MNQTPNDPTPPPANPPIISREDAEKVRKKNLANIIQKANAGLSLKPSEMKLIEQAATAGDSPAMRKAKNFTDLAAALGVTTKTIYAWKKKYPGQEPQPSSNRTHDVLEWIAFMRARGLNPDTSETEEESGERQGLENQKLRWQIERMQFKMAVERGEYVLRSAVFDGLVKVFSAVATEMDALELISPQIAGLPIPETTKRIREEVRSFKQHLTEGSWKKYFRL